jgi:nucleoid-associated protein EbfC
MKGPDIGQLMKQAQKMQQDMLKIQEELADETVESSVGGGSVSVTMTGRFEVTKVHIDPAAIDAGDPEMLEDLVQAAFNEALRQAQALAEQRLAGVTGGAGLPGML